MIKVTKGELTKQRILETAAMMFWKHSYHSVQVDKIVAQAKVNKASFYQYFKNKEQAAIEGIDYMFQRTKSYAFEGSFQAKTKPVERLEEIFKRIYRIHKDQVKEEGRTPGCPFVNIGNEMATDNEIIRKKVEKMFDEFSRYHQDIFEHSSGVKADLKPILAGRLIQGILNGAMTSAKIRNRPQDILDSLVSAKLLLGIS